MSGRKLQAVPASLARGRDRFQAWRRTRKVGTRIPSGLWALAVKLGAAHGIARTSTVLGVDYYSLKKRLDETTDTRATTRAFVELSPPSTAVECIVEFEDAAGASMRVRLTGFDAPDLVALSRSFWKAD